MPETPLTFIPATHFFAPAVALLHGRCFDEPWPAAAVEEILAMSGVFCLIAGDDGETASGFILCRVAADECEIITIGVAPEHRRTGIGSSLLDAALAEAGKKGAESAFLEVAVDNLAAEGLYRASGFTDAGRRAGYYRRAGGRVDALILAKVL